MKGSKLAWNNICSKTLGRYLALTIDRSEFIKHKIYDCVPRPKSRTTLNSWANPTGNSLKCNGDNQFYTLEREPTQEEVIIMLALALSNT